MENVSSNDLGVTLLRKKRKFNIDYYEAVKDNSGAAICFPYIEGFSQINSLVSRIIDAYPKDGEKIDIRFAFANDSFITFLINSNYSINFLIEKNAFVPNEMLLKYNNIKKRHYKKLISRIKKRYYVIDTSLRCTVDGVRIDLIDKETLIRTHMKIRNPKKISQIT